VLAFARRQLPRGSFADLGLQLAIWFGFLGVYQVVRGLADRHPDRAFTNSWRVLTFETQVTHRFYELTLQQFVEQRGWLERLVSWTYWNSEFTVLGLALLWVYLRRYDAFGRFRNTVLLANALGLVGYLYMPPLRPGSSSRASSATTATAWSNSPPTPMPRCQACTRRTL